MPRKPKPDPIKYCERCGAVLKRQRFNGTLEDMGAFSRRHYCNRICMAAAMEGKIRNLTPHSSRYQSAKQAKLRCEHCGMAGRRHVHHKDENPLNNDPANLQTLCVFCHRQAHSPYVNKTTGQRIACSHCSKPARQRGLCWTHLTRFRRYGDPLMKKLKRGSIWILSKVAE